MRRKRYLRAALLGVVGVVAGANATGVLRGDGPDRAPAALTLGQPGAFDAVTIVARPGEAVTLSVHWARNRSTRVVELLSYRPVEVPEGIRFIGAGVLGEDRPYSIGSAKGFPLKDPEVRPFHRPLDEGYRLAPFRPKEDAGTQLMVGFRAERPGFYLMRGLELVYLQDGRRRIARSSDAVGVCALSRSRYRHSEAELEPGGMCHSDLLGP